jgi:Tol biopolymer transport system component
MPDGKQLIYHSPSRAQLILSNWDDTGSQVIFDAPPDNSQISGGSLSGNGRTLVFEIWKPSAPPSEPQQIAVMNSDGSHLRMLPHDPDHDGCEFLSLSPDGTRIVCRVEQIKEGIRAEQGLRIVTLADGKTVTLTSGWDNAPAWSPRGDRIAFTGFETGDFEIYTIRPDGTGLRQLTHTHGSDSHPVWSPDGKWIAFLSSRMGWKDENLLPTGGYGGQSYGDIFVMRSDGTDVRQLTDNQREEGVSAWPPPVSSSAGSSGR